jgi:iron complex outermembrane receptor protein
MALGVLLLLAPRSSPGQGAAVVYGTVRDSVGGAVPQALIVAPSGRAWTDGAGAYRIAGLPPGRVRLRSGAIGFAAESVTVDLVAGDSTRVDFVLRQAAVRLNSVIVTASKRSQFSDEAVGSVAVVTEAQIAARAVNTIDEAVDKAPAVQFLNGQINIRGSSGYVQGLGSRVLLLVDGVPVNQGDRGGINWDMLAVDQVDHVEILKGPGSALYGSASLGGVVNLITRPIPSGWHLRLRGTAGGFAEPPHGEWSFRDGRGFHGGADLTASYGTGPFRGSLAAGGRHSDGYREQDGRDHRQVAGRGEWIFSPESNLHMAGSWAMDRYDVPLVWCTAGQCDDRGQAYQPFMIDMAERGARTESGKGYLSAAFSRLASSRLRWRTRGSWVRTRFNDWRPSDTVFSVANRFGAEIQAEARPSAAHAVTVGAEASHSNVDSDIFGSHTQGEYAAYGESEQPAGRARLTLGARMDFLAVDGGGLTAVLSPRAGLVVPTSSGIWRASAGRGFRAPAIAERFPDTYAGPFRVIQNPTLVPETSWSFEIGNTAPISERLRIDAAAFWTEARELIEPRIVNAAEIQFRNVSRAVLAGLDLTMSGTPITPRLTTTLAYMLLHARERAHDTIPEQPLAFRPRHLLTISADFDAAPLAFGADWRYMSRLERVEIYEDDPRVPANVLDLRASYRASSLQVHLLVANTLNYIYNLVPRTLAPVRAASVTVVWTY